MKKILPFAFTLGGVACLISVAVYAATPPAPATPPPAAPKTAPNPGDKFAAMIAEKLGLTDEQKSKLDGLRQAQRTALDAVAADKSLSDNDRRAKVRGIFESNREQMRAVLTPEQQKQVAAARDRFMGGRQGGPDMDRRGRGPGHFEGPQRPDPERMRFRAHRAHQMMQLQRERRAEELGLSDDQRAKMRLIAFQQHEKKIALQKEFRAEMEAVLTPEQKAKAAELKERHGKMRPGPHGPGRGPDGDKQGPPPDH
jgi:Spy/CpxP family protein refolding chaperone